MNIDTILPADEKSAEESILNSLRSWIAGRIPGELPPAWVQDYLNQYVINYFDKKSLIGTLLPFEPYPEDQLLHPSNTADISKWTSDSDFPKPADMDEYLYCASCSNRDEGRWEPSGIFTPTERIDFPCYNWNKGNPVDAVVPQKLMDNLSNELSCKLFTKIMNAVAVWAKGEEAAQPRFRFSHTFELNKAYEIVPDSDEPAWLCVSEDVFLVMAKKESSGTVHAEVPGRPNVEILVCKDNGALKTPNTEHLESGMVFYVPKNFGEFQMAHTLVPWVKKEVIWIKTCIYGVGRVRISRAALAKTAYYAWQPPKPEENGAGDDESTDEQAAPVEQ